MLSLEIQSLREFTQLLFTRDTFDSWQVLEAAVSSFSDLYIDGHTNPEFFAESEQTPPRFCSWGRLRPACFAYIRGKVMPLSFRISFVIPAQDARSLPGGSAALSADDQNDYTVLLSYKNHSLSLTTGILESTSELSFSRDSLSLRRENQKAFDRFLCLFLDSLGIGWAVR